MTKHILTSALFAGFAAGLIAALLQLYFVQPVLLEAELYESGELTHFAGMDETAPHAGAAEAGAHAATDHAEAADGEEASPLVRNGLSVLFSGLVYVGYGLILVAGFALARRFGVEVSARDGVIWGICGFVAAQLAPAVGLPPELPGSAAADLTARQIWWFATVGLTAAGLATIGFGKTLPLTLIGAALILAPQIVGAPQPDAFGGVAPPELAGEFAARSLALGLTAWVLLGTFAGYFWSRETQG